MACIAIWAKLIQNARSVVPSVVVCAALKTWGRGVHSVTADGEIGSSAEITDHGTCSDAVDPSVIAYLGQLDADDPGALDRGIIGSTGADAQKGPSSWRFEWSLGNYRWYPDWNLNYLVAAGLMLVLFSVIEELLIRVLPQVLEPILSILLKARVPIVQPLKSEALERTILALVRLLVVGQSKFLSDLELIQENWDCTSIRESPTNPASAGGLGLSGPVPKIGLLRPSSQSFINYICICSSSVFKFQSYRSFIISNSGCQNWFCRSSIVMRFWC